MFFTNLFKISHKCNHDKVLPSVDGAYCPDCGKYIKNEWYIARCSCCGVKLRVFVKNGEIVPQSKYCSNCGSKEYSVEKLEKINYVDIAFAALKKTESEFTPDVCPTTQCWTEKKLVQQLLPG